MLLRFFNIWANFVELLVDLVDFTLICRASSRKIRTANLIELSCAFSWLVQSPVKMLVVVEK